MLLDEQNELMGDLLFSVSPHGGDDVTCEPPIANRLKSRRCERKLDPFVRANHGAERLMLETLAFDTLYISNSVESQI